MQVTETKLSPYLDKIRALDFVRDLEFKQIADRRGPGSDGLLTLATPKGKFAFAIEQKSSYLDRSLLHALISRAKNDKQGKPLLLLTRYVPQPSAEMLIEHGVNFIDQAGNMHLALGNNYVRTMVGKKEMPVKKESKSITPAGIQLLFTFAADEQSKGWSVRELAKASGLSKSVVANIRRQFVEKGLLKEVKGAFEIQSKKDIEQELLRGYGTALRPRLLINRFRAAESSPERLTERISHSLAELPIQWSLTGGPTAYELQRFYRGAELPVFVSAFSDTMIRHLRLLPDARGPIILLRSFGTLPYWKEVAGKTLAHPWLIYSELMNSSDLRAHEAAEELKGKLLR